MCLIPACQPGLIHTAVMSGLEPETAYTYRVGDAGTTYIMFINSMVMKRRSSI